MPSPRQTRESCGRILGFPFLESKWPHDAQVNYSQFSLTKDNEKYIYISLTGQSLNHISVSISHKEIAAFLLTYLFQQEISLRCARLVRNMLISLPQNIIIIYMVRLMHPSKVITIFLVEKSEEVAGKREFIAEIQKGNPLGV
jgi:hypothetical protein